MQPSFIEYENVIYYGKISRELKKLMSKRGKERPDSLDGCYVTGGQVWTDAHPNV